MKEREEMASRRNSRYHIVMFVCSRYIITVCTSIRATSLYTEDEGERRWLPEGIPGITVLCLSVVHILLLLSTPADINYVSTHCMQNMFICKMCR